MRPESPDPKPRRNRHLARWICVGILAILGWYGWKAFDERQAVKEAGELGWVFRVDDPIARIRLDWRNVFRIETWRASRRELHIHSGGELEVHFDVIRRLSPTSLLIFIPYPYRDLSELKGLSNLTGLGLWDCPNLVNIDLLKELKGLTTLAISHAPVLSNFDGLTELKNLKVLHLTGCSGLTNVDALRDLNSLELLYIKKCTQLENVDGLLGPTNLNHAFISGCTALPQKDYERLNAEKPLVFPSPAGI